MSLMGEYVRHYRGYNTNIKAYLWHLFIWQLGALVYHLFFPLYLLALGYDERLMGSLFGLNTLAMAFCAIPAGILADKLGRRKSFLLGSFPMLVIAVIKIFTVDPAVLRLLYLVDGTFVMLFLASMSPFVCENAPPESRIHAFSLQSMGMLAAGIIGNLMGGYLPTIMRLFKGELADISLYRIIFLASVLTMTIGFLFLLRIQNQKSVETVSAAPAKWALPGKADLAFLSRYIVCAGLIALGAAHFMPFATTFFRRTYNASPSQLGTLFSLTQLTVFAATAMAPKLAERLQPIPAVIVTRILSLPLLFGISSVNNFYFAGGLFMLRNAFMQMSSPIENNFFVSNISPSVRATANGVNNMAMSLIRAGANFSAGIIITGLGYGTAIYVMLTCYIFSTFFLWLLFARGQIAKLLPQRKRAVGA